MAAAPDRNTGLPYAGGHGLAATIPFTQSQVQQSGPTATTGGTSGTERASQAASSVSSSINTTPAALQALEQLINQLSDRPAVDAKSVESKYPPAVRVFSPQYGWYWQSPTGSAMTEQQAQQYNAQQQAKVQAEVQAGGVVKGSSPDYDRSQAERKTEIDRNRQTQAGYTKEAASTDANALMQKAIADALEAAMPQITAGLEGAGTSRSTMASALTQKAALKGATEGAALSANLGTQYGQINTALSGVLEMLTRSDPNSPTAMLLQAIIASKGLVTQGTQASVGSTVGDKTATTQQVTAPATVTTNLNRTPTVAGVAAGNSYYQQDSMGNVSAGGYLPGDLGYREALGLPDPTSSGPKSMSIINTTDADALYKVA